MIMKKIKIILFISLTFVLFGCNSWLEKEPLTQFTDDAYWTSEANVKTFCNGFYSLFNGYGTGSSSTISTNGGSGAESDYYFTTFGDDQANNSIDIFSTSVPATSGSWTQPYAYIRLANLLLNRVDRIPISAAVINHYRGVGYFFRSLEYFDLVRRYGDVPFVNKYLDQDIDQSMIWGGRVNRNIVMDSVLNNLNSAINLLYDKSKADVNSVNKDVANAYKSRICLYEGTYSKYVLNNNTRAQKYLNEAKNAAEAVMAASYTLNTDYRTIYNSMDLTGNKEVLLYRLYLDGVVTHSVVGYCNSSTILSGLTKDAVESFLCTDGQPISLSPLYKGDIPNASLSIGQTTLKNRDKRLAAMVDSIICYTKKPNANGFTSTTGYKITKFDNATLTKTQILAPNNPTDAPIIALPEVLLNEAEACAELGLFTQTIADNTVNKLRTRGGVAALNVNSIPSDPTKDSSLSDLIWEVRRERRVELMMNGLRYWDLRRWGKVNYLDPAVKPDIFKGAKAPAGTSGSPGGQDTNGYILPYSSTTAAKRVITLPKYNLDPLPSGQLTLYKNAGIDFPQNSGW